MVGYEWDSGNKKKVYMGKYHGVKLDGSGYFGRNDAGTKHELMPGSAGNRREFEGSRTKEYTFSDIEHGTHTIPATSYEEALRIAESMGFTRDDYKKR